jgi:serine/threonine protein phosphatase PrpC
MELAFAAITDRGLVRRRNEDAYVADQDLGLFLVADGMGGHVGGEVASRTVADGVLEFVRATAVDPDKTWPFGIDPALSDTANRLTVAIRTANRKLADLVSADQLRDGAGATVSAALFAGDLLVVSNVGDCRAYLVRDGRAFQITRDHSVVAEQVARGLLEPEEARGHPMRHIITRAVSGDAGMAIDTWEIRVAPGDRVLLCSDGIHGLIQGDELSAIVNDLDKSLEETCHRLVETAKKNGGSDNATVVLVAVTANKSDPPKLDSPLATSTT